MKIAVILPSRGLMFSQTAAELLDNLTGYDYDIYYAHGLPIPECFEKPVKTALEGFCKECEETACRLCESGNNDTIEEWSVSKKNAQSQDSFSGVNLDDPTDKVGAINTLGNKLASQDEKQIDISTKTDTSKSLSMGKEKVNTGPSWNKNLGENLRTEKVSTISMENEMITDPKISNSGLGQSDTDNGRKTSSAHTAKKHTCSNHQALKGSYSHIWMVEDDMILPEGTLKKLLDADVPVATMDYPVSKEGQGAVFEADGKILFCGTGCMLIKREVFDIVRPPYFRTDVKWGASNHGKFVRLTAKMIPKLEGYGLHDVNFGMKLYKADVPISCLGRVGQRKLIAWGKPGSNNGAHQIEEWTKVKPNLLLKKYQAYPVVPLGKLITVVTKDGEITVHPTHAKKLIKEGIAKPSPDMTVGVDFNEIDL